MTCDQSSSRSPWPSRSTAHRRLYVRRLVLELDRCGGTVWTELAHSSPRLRDVVQRLRLEQQAATDARPEDLAPVWAPIVQRDLLLAEHRTWPSLMALKNWPRRERGNDLLTVLDRTSAAVHQQVGGVA